jgi:hypothetical protein
MCDTLLLPRGWSRRRVEAESIAGEYAHNERREGELVGAVDSGLVLRSRSGTRLYPWAAVVCVKLLEEVLEEAAGVWSER